MRKCATYPCNLAFGRICSSTGCLFEVWSRDSHAFVVRCLRSFAYGLSCPALALESNCMGHGAPWGGQWARTYTAEQSLRVGDHKG
eukprot:8628693-Alexandrium_andersonii.AAC.1